MVVTLAQELEQSFIRFRHFNNNTEPGIIRPRKFFEWIRLKKLCEKFGLEDSYNVYSERIKRNYVKTFIRMHLWINIIHSIAIACGSNSSQYYFYESIIYLSGGALTCLSLVPYFLKSKNTQATSYISSIFASTFMALTDCFPCAIAYYVNKGVLAYCYSVYTISCVYLFMPIDSLLHTIELASIISFFYCCHAWYSSQDQSELNTETKFKFRYFLPEVLILLGSNIIGIIFRIRHEYWKRKFFLIKCLYIEQNILLKNAKVHEHNLLLTIIPAQIAKKIEEDIKERIDRSKIYFSRNLMSDSGRKLFIQPHYNVSILFADVVNYTNLTTTLDVKTLVETLHELFQRFDDACQEFNCMRIKFLGDCYYCVSGVPTTHPYHALCCVELGRSVITNIEAVRTNRSLDINMRIGIHSGNILTGIIGAAKWQYDIWSKDVDIASRLEQTGSSGRVHISVVTLRLVEDYYDYEEGTEKAKNDPLLVKEGIQTFLIKQPTEFITSSNAWNNFKSQYKRSQILKSESLSVGASQSFVSKMHKNSHLDYTSIRQSANFEIENKVKLLPVCKLSFRKDCFKRLPRLSASEMEDYKATRNISVCCLWFEDWHWETLFNSERDELFKISVSCAVLSMWCIMGMQSANLAALKEREHLVTFFLIYSTLILYSITILFLAWFRTIHNKKNDRPSYRPRGAFVKTFYRLSLKFEMSWQCRIAIYLSLVLCLLIATFIHLMACDVQALENNDDYIYQLINGGRLVLCFNSWAVTDSICLCIAAIMTFNHIPHCLAFTLAFLIMSYYMIVVFIQFGLVYETSLVTNRSISAEYSHIWSVLTVFFIYQLMNRHVVFLARMNAYTKWNVERKRQDAYITNESIKILLNNILPSHVVHIYLSKRIRNEAYYEQHEFVAVLFATIIYARSGSIELRLLNEIICDFDEVLNYYRGAIKVEKIKVANWSYMAACGFNIFSTESSPYSTIGLAHRSVVMDTMASMYNISGPAGTSHPIVISSDSSESSDQYEDRSEYARRHFEKDESPEWKDKQRKRVLNAMTHFGLDLLRSIESFNISNQVARAEDEPPIGLRIGISCGEVMAGVVGSSQAHYDIWGNAVNMASRMDSTGEPGHIQVTEDAAHMLTSLNISCTYRGMTYVKGRGEIPTYFVDITSDYNFEHINTTNSFAGLN